MGWTCCEPQAGRGGVLGTPGTRLPDDLPLTLSSLEPLPPGVLPYYLSAGLFWINLVIFVEGSFSVPSLQSKTNRIFSIDFIIK